MGSGYMNSYSIRISASLNRVWSSCEIDENELVVVRVKL